MTKNEDYIAALETRMMSGEPFTYGMLCAMPGPYGKNGREADKLIQKWRRNGWIKMDGRIGRAPRWVFIDGSRPSSAA